MTDIEQKALALVLEIERARECPEWAQHPSIKRKQFGMDEALCRAIEAHEAFRQEISDVIGAVVCSTYIPTPARHKLERFIIAKPDPLVEAAKEAGESLGSGEWDQYTAKLRAAIEKRGGKIVWGEG